MVGRKSSVDLGGFGSSRVAGPKRSGRKFMNAVMLIILIALIPAAYEGWSQLYINFLERELPNINVPKPPVGLGLDPLELVIEVSDDGAGLYEVIVRGEQDDDVRDLFKKNYPGPKQQQDTIRVPLNGKDSGFNEGDFHIVISVFDRSFWTNGRTTTIDLPADYTKPKIEVITTQHNATLGGAELVFYRVLEKNEAFSGVKTGSSFYPGFPAKKLDADFEAVPDVYFSLFPIPLDFKSDKEVIRVFARDGVGNLATEGIYYRVAEVAIPKTEIALSEEFVRSKIEELLPGYFELLAQIRGQPVQPLPKPTSDDELIKYFRMINEDYRGLIERSFDSLFSRPKVQKLWNGTFSRMSGAARAPFGEQRHYTFAGKDAGGSRHLGVDLASTLMMPITAANGGIVIFADDLGIYGKSVILDHGFGLCTLYGHLSSLQVSEGDMVDKNQQLGKSGMTGLAGGDHLHFEVRLHGVPIRPIEWWDGHWMRDHIDNKISEVKKVLNLKTTTVLQ